MATTLRNLSHQQLVGFNEAGGEVRYSALTDSFYSLTTCCNAAVKGTTSGLVCKGCFQPAVEDTIVRVLAEGFGAPIARAKSLCGVEVKGVGAASGWVAVFSEDKGSDGIVRPWENVFSRLVEEAKAHKCPCPIDCADHMIWSLEEALSSQDRLWPFSRKVPPVFFGWWHFCSPC